MFEDREVTKEGLWAPDTGFTAVEAGNINFKGA